MPLKLKNCHSDSSLATLRLQLLTGTNLINFSDFLKKFVSLTHFVNKQIFKISWVLNLVKIVLVAKIGKLTTH